jgi:hypothetical protein
MATNSEFSPETLFRRAKMAAALNQAGYPIAPATLATMAVRGRRPSVSVLRTNPALPMGRRTGVGASPTVAQGRQHVRSRGRLSGGLLESGEGRAL